MFANWKRNNYIYILILVFFGIITHIEWFNPFSVLYDSDWSYWSDEAVADLWRSFGSWLGFSGLGTVNIQIYFSMFLTLWTIVTNIGFSYDIAVKITFLIPIAIGGFISPYILAKKIIKDNFIAFIGALFYGTTTYFMLRQTAHIPISFIYMIAPLFIYKFIKILENNKTRDWIAFAILNLVIIGYELRMVYILYWIILIYWLVFFQRKYLNIQYIKNYLLYGISLILLNIYWLLPTLSFTTKEVLDKANRGLFGNSLFSLERAITISESAWTGGYPNMDFVPQIILWQYWIAPLLILIVFLFKSQSRKINKYIIFFGLLSFVGILLTKQVDSPYPNLYQWMYDNFPGFNLFREASKFYMITAIGYLGLITISIKLIKDNLYKVKLERIYFILGTILIIILVYNTKPLLNKEIGTMFVSKEVPKEYLILKNKILEEDSHFRVIFFPTTVSNYGHFSIYNPIVGSSKFFNSWKDLFGNIDTKKTLKEKIIEPYRISYGNSIFDKVGIRYVVVLVYEYGVYEAYGGKDDNKIRDWYIQELDKVEWLSKVDLGLEDLVVYENEAYKDRIYLTKESETIYKDIENREVEFEQINSTEYRVKIKNLDNQEYLNFVEAYDPNWKVRIGKFDWKEVLYKKDYFVEDTKHTKSDINVNSYELSKDYIKANFDSSYYKENPDGSINIELTLYFKPQSYFYLGVIISGSTLILVLSYLVYTFYKNKKEEL